MSRVVLSPGRLQRLLGPAGPELACADCFEELDRYVEAQLEGREAEHVVPGMSAHLAGCPACSEEHASLLELVRTTPDR